MHKHISLYFENFRCLILSPGIDDFSNLFLGKLYENPKQSKPFSLKLLSVSHFGQTLFTECMGHCSNFRKQQTGLNCVCSDNNDNLAPQTNLALLYHSSLPCRVHAIHFQHCWYLRYQNFGHTVFMKLSFPHLQSNGFENSQCH